MRMGDHDYCAGNQHTFRQLYKDTDVTVEKCDHCDHRSVHIRDEDQENWCVLRDGEATSAFKVGKTMGYQYGYNEGKKDGHALNVEGEYDKGYSDGQAAMVGDEHNCVSKRCDRSIGLKGLSFCCIICSMTGGGEHSYGCETKYARHQYKAFKYMERVRETGEFPAGAIVDLGGSMAIYYPYVHPCREPYDQWVIFHPEGAIDVIRDEAAIKQLMSVAKLYGQLPFLTGE